MMEHKSYIQSVSGDNSQSHYFFKMMKYFFYLSVFFVIAVYAKPADKYTTKYDNVDLDEILGNDRLFSNYYQCLLDEGKCTPDGAELKSSLPDAIASACSKCSDKQKVGTEKVIKYLIEKKPDKWAALEKKYDPSGSYKAKYAEEAAKRGIKI